VQAVEAAVDAGVVMVFAAGNHGPERGTVATPGMAPKAIAVGASTTPYTITTPVWTVDVTAPSPVISDVVGAYAAPSIFMGPVITETWTPLSYVWAGAVATDGAPEGCILDSAANPFPEGSLTDKIVLIKRGLCETKVKVRHAQAAGAKAVVIYEWQSGPAQISDCIDPECRDILIPTLNIRKEPGEAMAAWYLAHPNTAQMQLSFRIDTDPIPPDAVARFSSRGPTTDLALKPDLVAPGVLILSSGFGFGPEVLAGFGRVSGTSMATPHVAGAAALLKSLHPDWNPGQIKSALMSTAKIDHLTPSRSGAVPTLLDVGAGRVDLVQAGDPGVTFDPPSIGFGLQRPGWQGVQVIWVTGVAPAREDYTVSISQTGSVTATSYFSVTAALTPVPSLWEREKSLSVGPGETVSLTLEAEVNPAAPPGDYEGLIWLRSAQHAAHIPVWVRVIPAAKTMDVLLLDNDRSSNPPSYTVFADYAAVYTRTLESLDLRYEYVDVDKMPLHDRLALGDLQRFKAVLWYTGDNDQLGDEQASGPDQALLMQYLDAGGRLLATGQNFSRASAFPFYWDPGSTRLYQAYLGAEYIQDSVFAPTYQKKLPPKPSVTASNPDGFLGNMRLDLSQPITTTPGAGAGNQVAIDEIGMLDWEPTTAQPLFTALSGQPRKTGHVALMRTWEPSLEESRSAIRHRAIYLGFGLEGINDNTGYPTRAELTRKLLHWLMDEVSVSLAGSYTATVGASINLSGTATSSIPGVTFTQFRWDFGDGTPIQTTFRPSVLHTYKKLGTYTIRVEGTDSYGHRGLASTQVRVLSELARDRRRLYFPYVARTPISSLPAGSNRPGMAGLTADKHPARPTGMQ